MIEPLRPYALRSALAAHKLITAEQVRKLFHYDPDTGVFTRLVARGCVSARAVVGNLHTHGYLKTNINGRTYRLHRLAWLYVYGEWPDGEIDHINRRRDDNRLANLRVATRAQNMRNTPRYSTNRSGFKGVAPYGEKWRAQITVNGKQYNLGYFPDPQSAAKAYAHAARHAFKAFARTE